jgi:hypothetical protein
VDIAIDMSGALVGIGSGGSRRDAAGAEVIATF